MEVFTYLRRISSLQILSRFVVGMESYTPKLLKYVSLRALNLENQNKLNSKIQSEHLDKILKVVRDQILKVNSSEWTPSELVSVMNFIASLEFKLDEKTKVFFTNKIKNLDHFNLYDIVQILKSQKKLKIPLDTQILLSHIKNNINVLLKTCSVANIYSLLNALLDNNLTVDLLTLVSIFQHLEDSKITPQLSFKDLTNLYNSVSRHIKFIRSENINNSEQDNNLNMEHYRKVESFLKILYNNVLSSISSDKDDFEGIVDAIDSLVNSNSQQFINHDSYSQLVQNCKVPFNRAKHHLNNNRERLIMELSTASHLNDEADKNTKKPVNITKEISPKHLKVLLRNMVAVNWDDLELLHLVFSYYNETQTQWSLQGNVDILKGVIYFGFNIEFPIEKWMKCVNVFSTILTPRYINEIFLLLAIYNSIYKCENLIEFFIQTDLIREDVLTTGFHILSLSDPSILNKLSIDSLKKLNCLDLGLFTPNLYILNEDSKNVGMVVQELYDKPTFFHLNLNFLNFSKFVLK
ncbi:uncharacterized protein TA02520 [Theileria annulata]|uniref:Uncharacterized protein n=1 Tax=Theileria annulata TaxID=5874 RepID=Q4UD07_THEAN|nr:uncharacterized protein TA02520 [Theileria annulata]CAI75294.1 hypothetical protein TA02520 [Theileria annulata]|eukprot:XP_954770.1 hypothetical protein TA02520 [Theileria annulata]